MAFILYTKYTIGKIPYIYKKYVLYFYIGNKYGAKTKKKIVYLYRENTVYIREYRHNLDKIKCFYIYIGNIIQLSKEMCFIIYKNTHIRYEYYLGENLKRKNVYFLYI